MTTKTSTNAGESRHPFGELLDQYRARKPGLSQTRLAQLAGYDQAILVRMAQGKKDLTGPSGRERVIRIIETLADQGALTTLEEANALLLTATMPPLFEHQPIEAKLIAKLSKLPLGHRIRRTNLPAPLAGFIGRAQEIADVRRLLKTTRLLTLTGSGGAGKTRLAQQVAADVLIIYPDGVWYVELAALQDGSLIADALVRALGLAITDRPALEQVCDFLRERHVLLVLDNCEHLIDNAAAFAIEVLQACPRVTILTTSREALNVEGETAWRVPPMQPEEAAQLFIIRAQAARSGMSVNAHDTTVVQICRRLDGMPLAIELAAARLNTLSLSDIASRLDDRFNLLAHGRRGALPRHQTLRAMIDWSYELLTEEEKVVFRRLGVFVGGWTLEDAEQIVAAGHFHKAHAQLANKSLVTVDEAGGQTRYHFLETLREYALEKLGEAGELDAARRRHAEVCARLAEQAEPHIHDRENVVWVKRIEQEHDNIRAALTWSLSETGVPLLGLKIGCHMWLYWWQRHVAEGVRWMRRLLEANGDDAPAFEAGRAWLGLGSLLLATARAEEIKACCDLAYERLSAIGDREGTAFAIYILGCCKDYWEDARVVALLREGWSYERWQGNSLGLEYATYMCMRHHILAPQKIAAHFDDFRHTVEFAEAHGDPQTLALAYFDLSRSAMARLDFELAYQYAQFALHTAQQIGSSWELCASTNLNGEICRLQGNLEFARQYCEAHLQLIEAHGWPEFFKINPLCTLGRIARDAGDFASAHVYFVRAAHTPTVWPIENHAQGYLDGIWTLACCQGKHERAAIIAGTCEAVIEATGFLRYPNVIFGLAPYFEMTRNALGEAAYEAAFAAGRAMPLEKAIAFALDESALSIDDQSQGTTSGGESNS